VIRETTKKFREPIAFGMLIVAALYFVSGLAVLFKSRDDLGLTFSGRAALVSHVFSDPVLVIALAAAVALVVAGREASRNAKAVVLIAIVIGAFCLLFALISWLSGLSADGISAYGGLNGAGRIVGIFLGLAQVGFLGLALAYAFAVFQSFPKTAKAPNGWASGQQGWGAPPQQWGQPQQSQQPWGQEQQPGWGQQPQQAWTQPPQQSWGQPQQPQQPQQPWAQSPQQGWTQPEHPQQSWPQQQPPWGEPAGGTPPSGSGWHQSTGSPSQQSGWNQSAAPTVWGPPADSDPAGPSTWETPAEAPPAHVDWSGAEAAPGSWASSGEPGIADDASTAMAADARDDAASHDAPNPLEASAWDSESYPATDEPDRGEVAAVRDSDDSATAEPDPETDKDGWWRPSTP
jgi:hypothetical protein